MGNVIGNLIENCNCGSTDNKDDEIQQIKRDIHTIKNNHLYHIEKDMFEMKMDIKIILMKLK